MNQPWECFKCGVVYAPYIPSCECGKKQHQIPDLKTNKGIEQIPVVNPLQKCNHVWNEGVTIPTCKNCGIVRYRTPRQRRLA